MYQLDKTDLKLYEEADDGASTMSRSKGGVAR